MGFNILGLNKISTAVDVVFDQYLPENRCIWGWLCQLTVTEVKGQAFFYLHTGEQVDL